jgi:hypothetical protein
MVLGAREGGGASKVHTQLSGHPPELAEPGEDVLDEVVRST